MNNMTEKLIKDGSETRRARMNMVSAVIGAILLLQGFVCLFIKANSVEYIDSAGILHENFYLLPTGFLFIFCGVIIFCVMGLKNLFRMLKEKRREKKNQAE